MNRFRIIILLCLSLVSTQTFATEVFLETFAPEDASYTHFGWILSDESYIGVRFSTAEVTHLSSIVGNFLGNGTYFSAITSLSGPGGFPTPTPGFFPSDMLAYSESTIINATVVSKDNPFDINLTLAPGNYFVFFGGVGDSIGYMPWATDLSKSNIPLSDYLEFSLFNGWFEFEPSGVRIALLTSQVPAFIDIKFCKDPNAFNCKKKGVLPVTIFGTDSLNIVDIDPSTLQLCREDLSGCTNSPRNWSIADRGDPSSDLGASMCAINPDTGEELDFLNPDGFLDLDLGFDASEVQAMLGVFCDMPKNAVSDTLIIVGSTFDGTPFQSGPVNNTGIDQLVKKNH